MLELFAINGYPFWLLLGLLLLVSELFVPGLIAAFFGVGALVVGLLTLLGILDSTGSQLLCFAVISVLALFALRKQCQRWLRGAEADPAAADLDDGGFIGARVEILTDFEDGAGDVLLNGAKWDAESAEPLRQGASAWVTGHRGIVLTVGSQRP